VHFCYYRLKEPRILHLLWGSWRGFSVTSPTNLNGSGWNLEYKWGTTLHSHKKLGEIAQWLHLRMPKRVLFFLLSPIQCGLSATDPIPILSIFEIKDVNRCAHAQTVEIFLEFLRRGGVYMSQTTGHARVIWVIFRNCYRMPITNKRNPYKIYINFI